MIQFDSSIPGEDKLGFEGTAEELGIEVAALAKTMYQIMKDELGNKRGAEEFRLVTCEAFLAAFFDKKDTTEELLSTDFDSDEQFKEWFRGGEE